MKVECFDVTVKASEMPVNPQKVQPTDNVFFTTIWRRRGITETGYFEWRERDDET